MEYVCVCFFIDDAKMFKQITLLVVEIEKYTRIEWKIDMKIINRLVVNFFSLNSF